MVKEEDTAERELILNPLRIHVSFQEFVSELSEKDVSVVKECIDIVTTYLKQVLFVVGQKETLLLKRSACYRSWLDGPNKGKCAYKRRHYSGEYCKGGFKIPDEHLEGFDIWQYNATEPKTWFRTGRGIRNTDYILYVQAVSTSECVMANYNSNLKSIVAYSAECKFGRYAIQAASNNRPIAGYINFCPSMLKDVEKNKHKFILTVIHEVFHGLGFSKAQFGLFRDCSGVKLGSLCPPQRFPLYRQIQNYTRILTATVVRQMQNHFLCYDSDYGGPLDIKRHKYVKDVVHIQSHWDSYLMYGSIMAPSIKSPELTFVDPISLAVLEDSGWYKVNYSSVDYYPWGQGKGCTFVDKMKDFNDATCKFNGIEIENGCNVYHTHKVACDGKSVLNSDITTENSCSMHELDLNHVEPEKINTFLPRCLLSNLTKSNSGDKFQSNLKGHCFKIHCLDSKKIEILLNESAFVPCPVGNTIDLSSLPLNLAGIIVCPVEVDLICFKRERPLYLQIEPEKTSMNVFIAENVTAITRLNDPMQSTESHLNMTSSGTCLTVYEKVIIKMFYTSLFCLIVLHMKVIERLIFCMF